MRALEAKHHELAPLYAVKRLFVQRKAMNTHRADVAATFDGPALRRDLESALGAPFTELGFADAVTRWQQDEAANAAALDVALRYAAWASHTAGRPRRAQGRRAVPRAAQARLHEARPGRVDPRERRERVEARRTTTCGGATDSR